MFEDASVISRRALRQRSFRRALLRSEIGRPDLLWLGAPTAQYRATRASAVRLFPESAPKGNLYSVSCRSSGSIPAPEVVRSGSTPRTRSKSGNSARTPTRCWNVSDIGTTQDVAKCPKITSVKTVNDTSSACKSGIAGKTKRSPHRTDLVSLVTLDLDQPTEAVRRHPF
jgi:hypothetical protein